jgi:hypothetical protein
MKGHVFFTMPVTFATFSSHQELYNLPTQIKIVLRRLMPRIAGKYSGDGNYLAKEQVEDESKRQCSLAAYVKDIKQDFTGQADAGIIGFKEFEGFIHRFSKGPILNNRWEEKWVGKRNCLRVKSGRTGLM